MRFRGHEKRCHHCTYVFGHMQTAKAQIILRISAVWSRPSLPANRVIGQQNEWLLCARAGRAECAHFAHARTGDFFAWSGSYQASYRINKIAFTVWLLIVQCKPWLFYCPFDPLSHRILTLSFLPVLTHLLYPLPFFPVLTHLIYSQPFEHHKGIKVHVEVKQHFITNTRLFEYIESFTTKNWKFSDKKL